VAADVDICFLIRGLLLFVMHGGSHQSRLSYLMCDSEYAGKKHEIGKFSRGNFEPVSRAKIVNPCFMDLADHSSLGFHVR
jgi:hypothetical protein